MKNSDSIRMRDMVEQELRAYPTIKKKIALLEFELTHHASATGQEVILGMSLGHATENYIRQSGFISDKTMRIALEYQDKTDWLNRETVSDIANELSELHEKVDRLEFYVSQLEEKEATVMRRLYFDGLTWRQLQAELHMSTRTLAVHRDRGLDQLAAMLRYLDQLNSEEIEEHTS